MGYSISEISKLVDISPYTLRYYEKEGLISISRKPNGLREFSEFDLGLLNIIVCLRETNMSIKDMKTFMDIYREQPDDLTAKIDILNVQRITTENEIKKLEKNLDRLNYEIWYYKNIDNYGDKYDSNHCAMMRKIYDGL